MNFENFAARVDHHYATLEDYPVTEKGVAGFAILVVNIIMWGMLLVAAYALMAVNP